MAQGTLKEDSKNSQRETYTKIRVLTVFRSCEKVTCSAPRNCSCYNREQLKMCSIRKFWKDLTWFYFFSLPGKKLMYSAGKLFSSWQQIWRTPPLGFWRLRSLLRNQTYPIGGFELKLVISLPDCRNVFSCGTCLKS